MASDKDAAKELFDAFNELAELQREIDRTAESVVRGARSLVDYRAEYAASRLADYPALDAAFYDRIGRELEAVGLRTLGDYQDITFNKTREPAGQGCYRFALSSDGTLAA